jgi:hypothetical protein
VFLFLSAALISCAEPVEAESLPPPEISVASEPSATPEEPAAVPSARPPLPDRTDWPGPPKTPEYILIEPDTEPPVISGLIHKTVFAGDTIAYRAGVTVTDNRDAEVELIVDSSAVNLRVEGVYPVIYSATDSSGNTATVEGSVTVHSVTPELADELADDVLLMIMTEDMTPLEQARAIYDWVKATLHYTNSTIKDNVALAAYRGLKYGMGDCYIYYAVAEVLLTRAGIENIPIRNVDWAVTRHYWSLVDVGGGWHHFDTTPHETGVSGFMLTDSQAQAPVPNRSRTYYTYDQSLYPGVVP